EVGERPFTGVGGLRQVPNLLDRLEQLTAAALAQRVAKQLTEQTDVLPQRLVRVGRGGRQLSSRLGHVLSMNEESEGTEVMEETVSQEERSKRRRTASSLRSSSFTPFLL